MAHVLVIEDDQDLAWLLSCEISEWGHRVTISETAEEAYPLLESGQGEEINCVLTDMRLGEGDHGDMVLKKISLLSTPKPTLLHSIEGIYLFPGKMFPTILSRWVRQYSFAQFRKKQSDLGYIMRFLDAADTRASE